MVRDFVGSVVWYVRSFVGAVWNRVASEPAVTVGIVLAAWNGVANGSDWKVYVAALGAALFRFAVTPVLPKLP